MVDADKTKPELITELQSLRARVRELEVATAGRQQTELRRKTFDTIDEAILFLDGSGRILKANRAAARLFPEIDPPLVGKYCYEVLHCGRERVEDCPHCITQCQKVSARGEIFDEHRQQWLHVSSCPLEDQGDDGASCVLVISDITDRKRDEDALRASERRYRHLIETMNDGFGTQGNQGRFTYVNPHFCEMVGYARDELIGRSLASLCDPVNLKILQEQGQKRKNGERKPYEIEWTAKDGRKIPTLISPQPLADDEGQYVGSSAVVTDITERKRTEEAIRELNEQLEQRVAERTTALRESESRYRSLVEHAADGIFIGDEKGQLIDVNSNCCAMLGYTRDELLEIQFVDLIPEQDLAELPFRNDELRAGKRIVTERHLRHKDGRLVSVEISAKMLPDRRILGIARDITERKRTEDKLLSLGQAISGATGERFFRELVEHLARALEADYAFIGELVDENAKRARSIAVFQDGKHAEGFEYDLAGTPCENVASGRSCAYPSGVRERFPRDRMFRDMGVEAYVGTPLTDTSGRVLGVMDVLYRHAVDNVQLTESMLRVFATRASAELERKRAEEALRESEWRYRTLFDHAPIGLGITTDDGTLLAYNDAMLEPGGYTKDDIESIGNVAQLYADSRQREQVLARVRKQGYLRKHEVQFKRKDGTNYDALLSLKQLTLHGQRCVLAMVEDITERKQAEDELEQYHAQLTELVERRTQELEQSRQQLRQSERLASLGTLAAGIAHEINNPNGATLIAAQTGLKMLEQPNPPMSTEQIFRSIVDSSKRCGIIVKSVLQFARQEETEKWPTNPVAVARRAVDLTKEYADQRGATIELTPADTPSRVVMNPIAIEQVLINLIRNAVQSLDTGTHVTVAILDTADEIHYVVQDKGRGISQEEQRHLFDPFYTTRRHEGGTGLGLSVVHGIITEHGGTVEVASQVGEGTTVTVVLPRTLTLKEQEGEAHVQGTRH